MEQRRQVEEQAKAKLLLEEIASAYASICGDNLVGVYVHGSLAFGCFHWGSSDLDFLVVTQEEPRLQEKTAMIQKLLEQEKQAPPKGFEMSVVLRRYCDPFCYPTPFVLHYSQRHQAECQSDPVAYSGRMHGEDWDLAAHFTVVHTVGMTLWGEKKETVFGAVPPKQYLDSIRRDITAAQQEVEQNPVYVLLNLCRVLAYQQTGAVLSKKAGAVWALRQIPQHYRPVVQHALQCYESGAVCRIEKRALRGTAAYLSAQVNQ